MATVPLVNRTGSITTAAVAIPDAAQNGEIVVTGPSVTDPTVRIAVFIDFSPDGGITWASTSPGPEMGGWPGGTNWVGGPTTPRGAPQTQFDISGRFPAGTNRKVRGIFVFDGNPFNGQAAFNVT